jgi:hypothetical protein
MQNINTPLPLYFKHHVPVQNWQEIKTKLDDLLELQTESHLLEIGEGKSTYNVKKDGNSVNPLDWDCLHYLFPEVWGAVKYAMNQWKLEYTRLDISQCWTNRHKHTGKTAFHKHGVDTQFVIAYYLNVPENGGDLLIIDPLQYHWNSYNSKVVNVNNTWGWRQKVNTGDMIIMPNFLLHGTEENKNQNEDRYVLTINVSGYSPIGENV